MWFRKKKPNPSDVIRGLRQQALTVTSAELGLRPDGPDDVWGVVMETGYAEAVATLVVLAEGTTSLYFSNGGGVIGAGEHAAVREAGKVLLSTASTHVRECAPARDTPVAQIGRVRLYLRTDGGLLGARQVSRSSASGGIRCRQCFTRRMP